MSFGTAVVQLVLVFASVAALFGAIAWWRFRRRGGLSLLPIWAGTVLGLGALGAVRVCMVLPAARRSFAIALGGVYAAFLAITLVPSALALRRRTKRAPTSGIGAAAGSSAAWSLVGILVATAIALTLDVFGIPFLPPIGSH